VTERTQLARRDFLKQAAAWTAAPALAGSLLTTGCRTPPATQPQPVIDVHVHANFEDELLRRQAKTISGVDFTPEGLRAEMAASDVEQAIWIGFETDGAELSREALNPMGLPENPAAQPANLRFVGGINPERLDAPALARIEEQLAAGRLLGLKIYLGYYPLPPDAEVYKPLYALAEKYNRPVIFHTGDTYSANAKVRFAQPLPIDDLAVDHRGVTFVLAHLGNPWTMDAAEVLYKNANVYADLSGFLVGDAAYFENPANAEGIHDAVERIRKAFTWVENPRKFLYGSDWPLAPMKQYLQFVKRAIDPQHHHLVFYENAKKVFRLATGNEQPPP
jgi:uncharacterized protein